MEIKINETFHVASCCCPLYAHEVSGKIVSFIFPTQYSDTGLEITAGQRTMSGLIVDLTGQTFVLPVMLTGQNSIVLKMK